MGWKGQQMPDNVLRFTLTPKLSLQTSGITTLPNLLLDGYAAFKNEGGSMLMVGEVVSPDANVDAVVRTLESAGMRTTAVHNHVLQETPDIKYLHFTGYGDPGQPARAVKSALASAKLPISTDEDSQDSDDKAPGLDVPNLEAIMKTKSTTVDGVLEFSYDRTESFTIDGHVFPPAMGPSTEIHFQSLGSGRAAVGLELSTTVDEVDKVIQYLRKHSVQVHFTALHNHWLTEEPRLFFVHALALGDQQSMAALARGAIDLTDVQ
jgi:hypothetical protein